MPFDPAIKRTEATLKRAGADDSRAFKVSKGAPHVVLSMCANAAEIKHMVDGKVHAIGRQRGRQHHKLQVHARRARLHVDCRRLVFFWALIERQLVLLSCGTTLQSFDTLTQRRLG